MENRMFSNAYLKKLIVPLIWEQLLSITVGMADTMMIASAGEAAVSGVSLVDMINNLIISVLAALATGGAVVCSQRLGAKKERDACQAANQLMYTAGVAGLLIAAAAILLRRGLVGLFFGSIEQDVMDNALIYLLITAMSFPFLAVYQSSAALFRAMGNARVTLRVSVIMNIINVCGNALCVYLLKMGAAGVAVPSLVSRAAAALLLTRMLFRRQEEPLHLLRERIRPERDTIGKILSIGVPSGLENGIFQLGRVLVVSIISTFGTVQIAANGVANSLDSVSIIMGQAMNLAMISVIGQCVGAQDEEQVVYYAKKLIRIAYWGTIPLCLTLMALLRPILSLYHLSPETTELTWLLVMLHAGFAIPLWPLSFTLPNMLRACSDVRFTMYVSILSMFMFRIGLSFLLGVWGGMGAVGVWIGMIVDWVFRSALFIWRVRKGGWKKTMKRSL